MKRLSKTQYYLEIAHLVSTRSNCIKRQVGAIIVKDDMIVATGYNGTPRGYKNCAEGGCARCNDSSIPSGERLDECLCVHAEQNAITHAAYHGISVNDSTLYCRLTPCLTCSKLIINAGIKHIVVEDNSYAKKDGLDLLSACGVTIVVAEMFRPLSTAAPGVNLVPRNL